ncbi:MAG: S8 family serine peptidase [Actinomycetota bacterium]
MGLLCGLLAVVGAAASGAGTLGRARESLHPAAHPVKVAKLDSRLAALHSGSVRVELLATRPSAARKAVARGGGRVEAAYGRVIEALVPARSLEALARSRGVRFVREPARPVADSVRGQGVASTGAALWHKAGARGEGVKLAIVDLGFNGYRQSQGTGDLPGSAVKVDLCGSGGFEATSHGTAVAEIVAEMAPGAKLYLVCIKNLAGLGQAVAYAQAHGIQIISHSVSWFNTGRGDGSGGPDTPEGIVAAARSAGILWVNAAGNRAQQHWSGAFSDENANGWHEFGPGDEGNTIAVQSGATACVALKWDDWPASAEDYDLYLSRSAGGAIVATSTGPQTGFEPPTELACFRNSSETAQSYAIGIRAQHVTARPTRFDLFAYPGPDLEYRVAEGSVTEPGTSPSALTVGAVCWQGSDLERYSSQGPTIDARVKPDLVGPDSVSSLTFGPFSGCGVSGFAGTSAATPHVAAAAALVKQANPSFGPSELQAYLEDNAVDLGVSGKDSAFGSGKLMLGAAPRLALRACVVPSVVGRRLVSARQRIERAGCRVGSVRRARSRARVGRVAAQHPRAGKRLIARGRVNLIVSRGRG